MLYMHSPDSLQTLYRPSTGSLQTLYRLSTDIFIFSLSLSLPACLFLISMLLLFLQRTFQCPASNQQLFLLQEAQQGHQTMIQMFQMFQLCFGHFGHPPFPQYASADTSIILHLCINVYHFRFVHHRCIDAEYLPKKHIKHNCIRNINVPCIRAEVYVWGKRDVGI